MTINEYQQQAMTTINPALSKRDGLVNSVMGLCGESGEAMELVKKWLFHGHPLSQEDLLNELGDVAWYLAEAASALEIPLEYIFQGNLDKLKARYPDGFEDQKTARRNRSDSAKYSPDRDSSDR